MDCQQVSELLDAYALGAAEKSEAEALERHISDCVRCWEGLSEAQRTAALLALSPPRQEAPPSLRDRLLERARREARPAGRARAEAMLSRLWPVGAGALAASALAALALAVFTQAEMADLRDENSDLGRQLSQADSLLGDQRQLMAVLAAPDLQKVSLRPDDTQSKAVAVYYWSEWTDTGFLVCANLPRLAEGQFYQAWLMTDEGEVPVGSFRSWKGIGQIPVDLETSGGQPTAIAVSIEDIEDEKDSEDPILVGAIQTRR